MFTTSNNITTEIGIHDLTNALDTKINQLHFIKTAMADKFKQLFDKTKQQNSSCHNCSKIMPLLVKISQSMKQYNFCQLKQNIQKQLHTNKQQLYFDMKKINNFINNVKISYEDQVCSLKEQIKRQYKVIALMKQEVQDLMEMLNYTSQVSNNQTAILKQPEITISQDNNDNNQSQKSSNNNQDYRIRFDQMQLEIIQEETQRTLLSSQRSVNFNYNQLDGDNQQSVEKFSMQVSTKECIRFEPAPFDQNITPSISDVHCKSMQSRDEQHHSLDNHKSDNYEKQHQLRNCIQQNKDKHLESIFCFHDDQSSQISDPNLIQIKQLNSNQQRQNGQQNDNDTLNQQSDLTNKSLFFGTEDQKQEQQSLQKYNSYMKVKGQFSGSKSKQKIQRERSLDSVSFCSQTQEEVCYQTKIVESNENSHKISSVVIEKGQCSQSHTKRKNNIELKNEKCWESLSQRIIGFQDVNYRNIQNTTNRVKKFETQSSADLVVTYEKQQQKYQPKTKQFLEQFRKTFNKCLNSMHAAKKHSTKNNVKTSTKSNGNSNNSSSYNSNSDIINPNHQHTKNSNQAGNITFGKFNSTSESRAHRKEGSNTNGKESRQERQNNMSNKQNLKALDHMLKELESNNNFIIGNKKIQLKYEGDKKNGLRSGNGILYYSNGLAYEGEFKQGYRHGYGVLKFNHIEIYNGDWCNDKMEGQGKIRNCAIINKRKSVCQQTNGISSLLNKWISYCGEFKNSKFQGAGTLYLQGGEKFVGNFGNGVVAGDGAIYRKNGEVEYGSWKNNMLVQRYQ